MHNFSKALKNTLLFFLIILLLALPLPVFYFEYSAKNWTATSDIMERNFYAGKITTLFSGASHGLRAFMPEIYDTKLSGISYNLCGTLCTMKGRYALLKEEIERNPVNTVILEVSYNSLSRDRKTERAEGDLDIIRRLANRKEKVNYALKNLSIDEWSIAYYLATHNGFSAIVEKFTLNTDAMLNASITQKGYQEAPCTNISLTLQEYILQHHTEIISERINPENLEYLNKILTLCKEKNIDVIMIVVPISDRAINRIANLETIKKQYVQIATQNQCDFYDFNLWKDRENTLSDYCDFYDDFHLSGTGAKKFSNALSELMALRKEGTNISNFFYHSYKQIPSSYHTT